MFTSDGRHARSGLGSSVRTCLLGAVVMLGASAAQAQYSATATWNRNSDSYTAGYRLYYGTVPGSYPWSIDAGNQTSAALNLSPGTYYFVVRAYNMEFRYGPASPEVRFIVGSPTATIQASLQSNTVAAITWQTANAVSATLNGQPVPVNGSTTQPINATTTFTIRAVSSNGQTAMASATVTVGSATAPHPPLNLAVTTSGSRAAFSWQPNPTGGIPEEYLLFVSTTPSGSPIFRPLVGNVLSYAVTLAPGTYYARVRARNAFGTSGDSNVISFRIGT